eukprot:3121759-Pyramimonas_sp.AAC.1
MSTQPLPAGAHEPAGAPAHLRPEGYIDLRASALLSASICRTSSRTGPGGMRALNCSITAP